MKEKSRIYLSGGGNERQTFMLDAIFFNALPCNGRILYIPMALRGYPTYATTQQWMRDIFKLHKRSDLELIVIDEFSNYDFQWFKGFDGVYIGGGNTWSLMEWLKKSGTFEILTAYSLNNGLIYGGSAGAIVLGKRIDTSNDENIVGLNDASGINLLSNYSVTCHFKIEQSDKFQKWAINNKLSNICLPEESGLVIENGVALCVGSMPCTVYFADGKTMDVDSGQMFVL